MRLRAGFIVLWCIFFFALLLVVPGTQAQTSLAEGGISGTVTDSSGSAIAGASVTISGEIRSIQRRTVAAEDGGFQFSHLPSGDYRLVVTAPGFASYKNGGVTVSVGRNTLIDVRLLPAQAQQKVTVAASASSLDPTETSPVTNIDKDRIEELPIASRNYLNFALLAPPLAPSNPALGTRALSLGEAGSAGFSSGGLRPSSNALYIDGVDDNDEFSGLSRTELSPEAISDFQIVNHGYAAESGGSAGGAINVETRSGANLQHGDAFLFVQNGALNATPALELVPRKPDENRLRAGLSTGGALRKNRSFYYLAAEQEMARGEDAGDFGPNERAAIDRALRGTGPLRGFRLQDGFFPTENDETEFSARFDQAMGQSNLMLRYALTNNRSVNDAFHTDDLSDLSGRGSAFYNDNSINGAWSFAPSASGYNQLTFEVSQRRVALRTDADSEPGVEVAGVAEFGTPYAGNSRRYETHVDVGDGLMRHEGRHLLQAGVAFSHVGLRMAERDGFEGLYVFPDVASLASGQPDFYVQSFGNPNTNLAELRMSAYVQDHWTPTKKLALDYGLRYEYNRLPSWLPQDVDDVSPRLGFAFSPKRDLVLRGGFGIFFDRYLLSTLNRVREFGGAEAFQQIAEGSDAAALYGAGERFVAPHAGIAPSIWRAQGKLANPYAETSSLGMDWALPAQWTLGAEYRFVHGVKMGRTVNINLPTPVPLTAANAASLGVASPTPQQIKRLVFPETRIDPAFDTIHEFQAEAGSSYNGVTVTLNRQFTEEFEMMAGYTYSKTLDDASFDTEEPQNPYSPTQERAASLDDQRQRFVLSGLWVLGPDLDDPQDAAKAAKPNAFEKVVYGLEFAPIVEAGSGFHDDPLTGADSNREHLYPFEARPLGFARNSLRTPVNITADLRVLRMVPIWRGHLDIVAESFNLLNRRNTDLVNPTFGSEGQASPAFGTPIQDAGSRRVQFSLDYEY
ncbi:MAG TPA: TonB-dependent receptor [Acidobacteriaceae bacterium]|nr:TonB-dependent receptor [Acidobacteriaceae bacterium]